MQKPDHEYFVGELKGFEFCSGAKRKPVQGEIKPLMLVLVISYMWSNKDVLVHKKNYPR